jgi:hypothetical protein
MNKLNKHSQAQLTLLSFACLSVPLYIMALWIYLSNQDIPENILVEQFHSFFPLSLQGKYAAIYLSLVFSAFALIISGIAFPRTERFARVVNVIILLFAGALFMVNLTGLV